MIDHIRDIGPRLRVRARGHDLETRVAFLDGSFRAWPIRREIRSRVAAGPWLAYLPLLHLLVSLAQAAEVSPEFVRWTNLGKARLENRDSAAAKEAFVAAVKVQPGSAPAWRNLARACLLADQNQEALRHLRKAQSLQTNMPATSYLMGLAHTHQGHFEEAIPLLEQAVRLDPHTATLRYQLGVAYQLARQHQGALAQFRETVRLEPLHGSAHFKLGAYALQAGDRDEFARRHAEFLRLRSLFGDDTRTPAALERCQYTAPESAPESPPQRARGIPVRFVDESAAVFPDEGMRSGSIVAVLEVDAKGVCTLCVADSDQRLALLRMSESGRFTRISVTPQLPLPDRSAFRSCVIGDFHNDVPGGVKYDPEVHAHNDVFLLSTNQAWLLKRSGTSSFADVTASSGLASVSGQGACWVDYDHDGDLDLAVATQPRLQLWQNQGNGTFTNVVTEAGLGDVGGSASVAALDLDGNVAIDLVVARAGEPSLVFMSQRTGRFARLPDPPGPWPPAKFVWGSDFDNDGRMDVLCVGERQAIPIYGGVTQRSQIDFPELEVATGVLLDFDNDGWIDFCAAGSEREPLGRGALRIWRNESPTWQDVTRQVGLDLIKLPAVRHLAGADFDNDGDTDIVAVTATGRMHFLRNEGGHVNHQLKVRVLGTKTNPSGLGTQVELRAGSFRVVRPTSSVPIELGVARNEQFDSVQTVWSNGIIDNQLEVKAQREPLTIVEKNVAAGSCPYLYAWDGRHFRFVTDLLGNSPLGLSIQRNVVLPSDPEEIVFMGTTQEVQPRAGAYEAQITEELREVLYLDTVRLLAIDHPAEMELHSTDKLGPPPFPPSAVWLLRSARVPIRAVGDDGIDRTEAVRAIDGVFAPPGPDRPPPLRGVCQPLALDLDFGLVSAGKTGPVLALTGWLQYGDASANIAASQNTSLAVIGPRLEAETAPGQWTPVDATVGLPAGKTKTILCDLTGKLPPTVRRLRLVTTFEVRWDRIALFERASDATMRIHRLAPDRAELYWRGFSEIRSRAADHPQTPKFEDVSARPPWRSTPQGWCTRYGDVLELVHERDERLIVLNAGDALRLTFRDALPSLPPGQTRSFFFYSVGWDKDADHNVVAGDQVEPLPVRREGDWEREYNTRWVPGNRFGVAP